MNNVPHPREMRYFFYNDATAAARAAVEAGELRMGIRCTVPETNPEMDVYRIGTLLELVRELATDLAADGKKVKVSVQQSMGQGVFQGLPLSLSGVRRIMDAMDWGDALDFVSFGEVGADQIDDSDYYILIAPQNIVGNTIMTNLQDMAQEAENQKKILIVVNPVLRDIPSSGGVMGIRGRKERTDFTATFRPAYHFRLLYKTGFQFPIQGALRFVYGGEWEVYKRVNLGKKLEEYRLISKFPDEPDSQAITKSFIDYRKSLSSR